jgi:hypothetical protein
VDGEGKRCRVIRWPEKHRFGNAAFIGQSQGRLHCISGLRKQNVEGNVFQMTGLSVWILEDYDAEEWVLKLFAGVWKMESSLPLRISCCCPSPRSQFGLLGSPQGPETDISMTWIVEKCVFYAL